SSFGKDENGSIGVFATVGTVASKGDGRTLREQIQALGHNGDIQIFSQGGHGRAEAVHEDPNFLRRDGSAPREGYRGRSFDDPKLDDCSVIQLNDAENYVRYHLVSLMEQMRRTPDAQPLKALILGCTHYPYLIKEINTVFAELRNYKDRSGNYVYRHLIDDN